MHNLRGRIQRLEQQTAAADLMVVNIVGGVTNEPQHATFSGQQIDRLPHEDLAAFRVRAAAAASTAGARCLIIGGLAN
jgi:hypothetical protein